MALSSKEFSALLRLLSAVCMRWIPIGLHVLVVSLLSEEGLGSMTLETLSVMFQRSFNRPDHFKMGTALVRSCQLINLFIDIND